jgi:hypothetical protein
MYTLAFWFKQHPWTARLLIIFTHFSLGIGGTHLGLYFYANGYLLPAFIFVLAFLAYGVAYLRYPSRKDRAGNSFYRRKTFDGVLIFSLGLMWVSAGNRLPVHFNTFSEVSVTSVPIPNATASLSEHKKQHFLERWMEKARQTRQKVQHWYAKRLEKKLTRYAASGEGSTALLIILGILLTLVIALLTAAASCNLSCSGNENAAALVIILSIGLVGVTWILIIRAINANPDTSPDRRPQGVW